MADNTAQQANATVRTTEVGSVHSQHVIDEQLLGGVPTPVDASNPKYVTETDLRDWIAEVAGGNVPGHSIVNKYGRIPSINTADNFGAVWGGTVGAYTGFDATAAEATTLLSSSASDTGTVLFTGAGADSGTATTLTDGGATFVDDGVTAGDILINDTQQQHGFVVSTTQTVVTVAGMSSGGINATNDVYRVVTAGSTGASVVQASQLLSASGVESSEYVVLNGVTGVDTTGTHIRASRCRVVHVGSGGEQVGTITMRQKTTTANIYEVLQIGYGTTMSANYTVPAGKKGYIVQWSASIANRTAATSVARLLSRWGGASAPFIIQAEKSANSVGNGGFEVHFPLLKGPFGALTDIGIQADTGTNGVAITAGFAILLIDD